MKPIPSQSVERMMRFVPLLLAIALLLARVATAQDFPISTVTVPVVAHTGGADGMEWITDVALRNDLPYPVEIFITLTHAPGEPFINASMAPGQSLYFADAIRQAFGLREAISPLTVQTLAPKSVTVGAASYGLWRGRLTSPQYITPFYGDPGGGTQYLSGLSFTRYYRTNIGIGNVGDETVTFVLALQRIAGRNIAVTTIKVGPRALLQGSIRDFFPLIAEGEGFYLLVETNSSQAYAYASLIDNETQDAWYLK